MNDIQPFDYSTLDSSKLSRLQELAQQGRAHLRRTQESIIAFGEVLLEAKALLPHGQFRAWATNEFDLPDSTITYMMKKARGGVLEIENVNIGILPENVHRVHSENITKILPEQSPYNLDGDKRVRFEKLDKQINVRMREGAINILDGLIELFDILHPHIKNEQDFFTFMHKRYGLFLFVTEHDFMKALWTAQMHRGNYDAVATPILGGILSSFFNDEYCEVMELVQEKQEQTGNEHGEIDYKGRRYTYSPQAEREQ